MNTTYLGQAGSRIDAYAENVIWEESTRRRLATDAAFHNFYPDDWDLINRREVYELKNQKKASYGHVYHGLLKCN
jgi:hypothetical protein